MKDTFTLLFIILCNFKENKTATFLKVARHCNCNCNCRCFNNYFLRHLPLPLVQVQRRCSSGNYQYLNSASSMCRLGFLLMEYNVVPFLTFSCQHLPILFCFSCYLIICHTPLAIFQTACMDDHFFTILLVDMSYYFLQRAECRK